MKLLAFPRDRNPYQGQLYGALAKRGVGVRYVGELTPSQSLNLLLLPLELAAGRLGGARVLHIHWLFKFRFPGAARWDWPRRAAYAWLGVLLWTARACGIRVVWTVHNVLPHEPVFHDDVAARRRLIRSADLLIAHSPSARDEVAERLAEPRRCAVIPLGPPAAAPRLGPRAQGEGLALLFFGAVAPYKGVDQLLRALALIGSEAELRLTVAGDCEDAALRRELAELAEPLGEQVELRLEYIPDAELPGLLAAHDLLVLPFRRVTTSSSAMFGVSSGMPVLVPDLPAFDDLPVLRYSGEMEALAERIAQLANGDRDALRRVAEQARAYGAPLSWDDVAAQTLAVLEEAVAS